MNCQQIYKILLKKTKNQSENIQKSFREATFFWNTLYVTSIPDTRAQWRTLYLCALEVFDVLRCL